MSVWSLFAHVLILPFEGSHNCRPSKNFVHWLNKNGYLLIALKYNTTNTYLYIVALARLIHYLLPSRNILFGISTKVRTCFTMLKNFAPYNGERKKKIKSGWKVVFAYCYKLIGSKKELVKSIY